MPPTIPYQMVIKWLGWQGVWDIMMHWIARFGELFFLFDCTAQAGVFPHRSDVSLKNALSFVPKIARIRVRRKTQEVTHGKITENITISGIYIPEVSVAKEKYISSWHLLETSRTVSDFWRITLDHLGAFSKQRAFGLWSNGFTEQGPVPIEDFHVSKLRSFQEILKMGPKDPTTVPKLKPWSPK